MPMLLMTDLDLASKRVLIREDLNVPIRHGEVASDARIRAALPTLRHALEANARVMVMSHLGRPEEGEPDPEYSLAPVADTLTRLLGQPVRLMREWLDGVDVAPGNCVLCENVRFNRGERRDDASLSRRMAALCDVYVMDAFGAAHRAHASTHAIVHAAPVACAGPLLAAELEALDRALRNPSRPLVAIVGGAKVSAKLRVLERLCDRVDRLIPGGGIANTFIAASGRPVGRSLHEPDLLGVAARLLDSMRERGAEVPLPVDVVVAARLAEDAPPVLKRTCEVAGDDLILDIGPNAAMRCAEILQGAGTIVWNGPLGVFELDQFAAGTRAVAEAVAASRAFSIAGGGDTLAAIERFGVGDAVSYLSTGGGAFLEFLEGRRLPAVAALEARGRP